MTTRSSKLTILGIVLALSAAGCGKKADGDAGKGAATSASGQAEKPADDGGMLGKLKQAVSGDVTITQVPVKVGDKRKVDHTSNLTLTLKLGPKEIAIKEDEVNKRSEEVLAVEGKTPTKVKVTYETRTKTKNDDGKTGKAEKDVVAGKTFLVERKDGKLLVTNGEGKPVDAASKSAVEKDYKGFGKPDPLSDALPSRPLKVGEEVKELTNALTEKMKESMDGDKVGMTVEGAKITLEKKEGDDAILSLVLTLRMTKGPLKGTIPLKGNLTVRTTDGRLLRFENEGPINLDISEAEKKKGMSGAGSVKTVDVFTY